MSQVSLEQVTLAVLAGGEGSRMGTPKAMLRIRGVPILQFLIERIDWPGPTLLVTAPGREHPAGAEFFDVEASDDVAGRGPLQGISTALRHATTEMLIVIAVDMPGIERGDLVWFIEQLASRPDAVGIMSHRGGSVEPLPLALRKRAEDFVIERLASGNRSLHDMARDPRVQCIDTTTLPDRVWLNINTPDEWAQFVNGDNLMPLPNAYRRLAQEHPEVIKSYEALADAVRAAGPLDAKTAALVKLALALASGLEGGTHSAVRKALDAGCTREELLHVALLGTTTMGFPAMMRARSWVLDVLDKK